MIASFGYDRGPITQAHKTFDVRDLPHDPNDPVFKAKIVEILDHAKKNPADIIAIGSSTGKHRAVVVANRVASALTTSLYHRDLGR